MKSANSLKTKLSKELDAGNIAVQGLKKSNKEIATKTFVKSVERKTGEIEKARAKLVKKLALALTASDSTFKGAKNTWTPVITECEEANYLFCYCVITNGSL